MLNFGANEVPNPKESNEKDDNAYVKYGSGEYNNKYPNFLLELYNSSPIHSSIINSKATYIMGDGLGVNGKPMNVKVNEVDTMADFVGKVVRDYLIFNYFCVEVVYNSLKQPIQYFHVPAQKIRTNKTKTKFWYSKENWNTTKPDYTLERWKIRLGAEDQPTTRLFFFDGYFPSLSNVYPAPEYAGSIESIQTDKLIRKFNLNQIDNHFSLASLISFHNTGHLDQSVKDEYEEGIEGMFTGATGKKIMIEYLGPEGKPADVKNISANDWDKAYQEVSRNVADDIYRGHQVTSPMLFGVKTEGQLGGASELETAYEIFKNTYIRNKRNELAAAFNMMFSGSTIVTTNVEFMDRPLFGIKVTDTAREAVMSINEIREAAGLPAIQGGDKIYGEVGKATTPAPQLQPEAPQASNTGFNSQDKVELTEIDFDKVKDFGLDRETFELLAEGQFVFSKQDALMVELGFDDQTEIADYLISRDIKNMSIKELRQSIRKDLEISVTVSDLKKMLENLTNSGVVNVTINEDQVEVKKVKPSPSTAPVEVMYAYETREGYGEDILATSRSFCKKLMSNNRMYSRQDIQSMTEIFGYDIFQFGGGFYRKSDGSVVKHCRHFWKAYTVRRKVK
jgi:hypothetical protein